MIVSDKEERTCAASKVEQMDSVTSSSKTPLSRYHEKIFNVSLSISLSVDEYNLYGTHIYRERDYLYIK